MGRPEKAQACVQSIKDTAEDVEIVVAVDGPEADARALADMGCVVDHATEPRGSSRAWNDALAISTGDPVVLAADDLEFRYGWLDAALGTLAEFPDGWGLVGFNDGHWRDELSTHYLMSRRFIVECLGGVIAWDCYRHSFNDREANERARTRAGTRGARTLMSFIGIGSSVSARRTRRTRGCSGCTASRSACSTNGRPQGSPTCRRR
jgi:glycosyltransferase involved in cell wall biosynthesis